MKSWEFGKWVRERPIELVVATLAGGLAVSTTVLPFGKGFVDGATQPTPQVEICNGEQGVWFSFGSLSCHQQEAGALTGIIAAALPSGIY